MIANKGDSKMSWRRAKTSGWAAFDQKQKQEDSLEPYSTNESYPSLPISKTSQPAKPFSRNRHVKSFSSVALPSVNFPILSHGDMKSSTSEVGSSDIPQSSVTYGKYGFVSRQLKEQFNWADDSLIEDVMAAADNDFDKASSFLKAMVTDESSSDHNNVKVENSSHDTVGLMTNETFMNNEKKVVNLIDTSISEAANSRSILKSGNFDEYAKNDGTISSGKLFDDCMKINALLGQMTSVPIEPEWEEDDIYLSSRKDAIKMMRSASRHSKAATNSFIRGDHVSAQQLSLKAQEEWRAAQNLNAKAASEILSIRNGNNGIWRLDLHGLHASEAVQAVKERLFVIETQVLSEGSKPLELLNNFKTKANPPLALYPDPLNNLGKSDESTSHKAKLMWLEVITGIGNHSRGGAALPSAVRSFLADNGYRFDEARPGVIMVRPKFRPY